MNVSCILVHLQSLVSWPSAPLQASHVCCLQLDAERSARAEAEHALETSRAKEAALQKQLTELQDRLRCGPLHKSPQAAFSHISWGTPDMKRSTIFQCALLFHVSLLRMHRTRSELILVSAFMSVF